MTTRVFICTTRSGLAPEHRELGRLLEQMGYPVTYGNDICSPQGQRIVSASLSTEEQMVLICPRQLDRKVFAGVLGAEQQFYRFACGEEPKETVDMIHTEVSMGPSRTVVGAPPVRQALVIGGGVGGVYAALDIAEQGYPVYLVEKDPSIGGIMAALDKTFPTMDCSI